VVKPFRWNRQPAAEGQEVQVNLTPLIDVSLVLVVILLLATPLAFESSLGLRRTRTDDKQVSEEALPTRVSLDIISDTEVKVNDVVVPLKNLPTVIAPLLAAAASRDVAVRCADRVSHGTFVQVLDITKLCGATGIAVARN
jgi:biopolymer transport protein ExbD